MSEQLGNIDLRAAGSSYTDDEGVKYLDSANIGSGTGNYNTFLALGGNDGNVAGFNTSDEGSNDPSNPDADLSKSQAILLASVPIVNIGGIEYYEIRIDLNEANSDPDGQISLDQFKLYTSTNGTIESLSGLQASKLVYDLDAGGDKTLRLSEVSTGSGTDDYSILVPVSLFPNIDPGSNYLYVYAELGRAGGAYEENAGFEEFNLQKAVTLSGLKFNDADDDGVKDADEVGVGGVTIFVDTDKDGVFDAGERFAITKSDGSYSIFGMPTGGTYQIDEVNPGDSDKDGVIDVGESWARQTTGPFETVTVSAGATGTITVDPIGNFIPAPQIGILKTILSVTGGAGPNNLSADNAGDIINYRVVVTNSGNVALTSVNVSDSLEGADLNEGTAIQTGGIANDAILQAGETWTYSFSYTVTQGDIDSNGATLPAPLGQITNSASVSSFYGTQSVTAGQSTVNTPIVQAPSLAIDKIVLDVDGDTTAPVADKAGDKITYQVKVTNTGNQTLTNVMVVDPLTGANLAAGTLAPGAIYTSPNLTYTVLQSDIDSNGGGDSDIDNTATATSDQTGPSSDSEAVPIVQAPSLAIDKVVLDVDGDTTAPVADKAGDKITYQVKVTNTGNRTLTNVMVVDPLTGANLAAGTLAPGLTYISPNLTYTVLQSDIDSNGGGDGKIDNTATADSDQTDPLSDSEAVPIVRNPLVDLEKYISVDGGASYTDEDDVTGPKVLLNSEVFFKITLANTGNVTLTGISITDLLTNYSNGTKGQIDLAGQGFALYRDFDGDGNVDAADIAGGAITSLGVGQFAVGIYTLPFAAGQHTNTASVTTTQGATDNDAANYYGLYNDGPGVRTPGFWSNNGAVFWDYNLTNQPKAGQAGFADGELLYNIYLTDTNKDGVTNNLDAVSQGLLVGDYNKDGISGPGEDTLFISLADAKTLISASNKTLGGDGRFMLGRDMVATWLNNLAGNNIGDAGDLQSPKHYLNDAIDWMQLYSGKSGGLNTFDELFDTFQLAGGGVKTNTTAWNGINPKVADHSAAKMHNALDNYNNDGMTSPGGTIYAGDADNGMFLQALTTLSLSSDTQWMLAA